MMLVIPIIVPGLVPSVAVAWRGHRTTDNKIAIQWRQCCAARVLNVTHPHTECSTMLRDNRTNERSRVSKYTVSATPCGNCAIAAHTLSRILHINFVDQLLLFCTTTNSSEQSIQRALCFSSVLPAFHCHCPGAIYYIRGPLTVVVLSWKQCMVPPHHHILWR